ncbi:NAD(P)H-hydrate epimerase [Actibacterium sp.]|uniref:NAD(P)H-hydrate epimerase n=1 Tax=Actibacterium sp. TaxID=1872125 RepID=UPI003563C85C
MTELLTSAQMRAVEGAAIASGAVTGLELMERAGKGVVAAIFEEWPALRAAPHRAVVLCGPGNNGGDGFVIARLLHDWGWEVEVFLLGDPAKLPPDAKTNYERWCPLGPVTPLDDDHFDGAFDEGCAEMLVIDALFGTGLTRPFLSHRHLAMALNGAESRARCRDGFPKVVAVDIPSGLCADSGRWLGDDQPFDFANLANLTVSFHAEKLGHRLADGPESCGKTVIADIGLETDPSAVMPAGIVRLVEAPRNLDKLPGHHKYIHGHALVLSGPQGRSGAARLAARGALRIGAGLVTVGAQPSAMDECAAQLTAIMLRQVRDAKALEEVLADPRFNALCLGPGMGVTRDTREIVEVALAAKRATVLDADALTSFAEDPETLFTLLHENVVLTPHGGEFARLFPDLAEQLAAPDGRGPACSKVDATRAAAARAGCTILFKGPDTVIARADGACRVNSAAYERSTPWLVSPSVPSPPELMAFTM